MPPKELSQGNGMHEEWYFNVFDEFVYISDVETYELLYMNKTCCDHAKQGENEYQGKKCYQLLQGLDAPCPFCNNHLLTEDSIYKWEYTNERLGGHFSIKDKLINWKGRKARIELAVNITDYKEEVLSTELKMYSMLMSIPGGVCEMLADGSYSIVWYNEHFLQLIGYTAEQFEGELHSQAGYVHPEDLPLAAGVMEKVKDSGQPAVLEMRIIQRNGAVLNLLTSLSFKRGRAGQPDTFYSVGIDITEYKREIERSARALQDALVGAQQASQAKGRFLSRMSHEIRTPLNAVIGMASIASMSLDNEEVLCGCHKKIDASAKYLLSLINDILDVSRIESGKLELFRQEFLLEEFLADIKGMFALQAQEQQIAFSQESDVTITGQLIGDPLRFKQVVVNLLSNALKFTPEGGAVQLKVGELSFENNTVWLEVMVKDTGMGISTEAQCRIFETFEQQDSAITSRFGGSGLGLSISKHIVDLMGGTIAVRSEVGAGSCFVVQVPFAVQKQPRARSAGEALEPATYDFSGKRVLTVEDNDLNQEILVTLLEARGLVVEVASNGREAVDAIQSHPQGYFDLVLMDICMPVMDGLTATRAIRHLPCANADIPIIALSANAFEEDRQRSLESGMDGHVSKPVNMTELFKAMHVALTRPVPDRRLQSFLRKASLAT